jgi:hypothetical protein
MRETDSFLSTFSSGSTDTDDLTPDTASLARCATLTEPPERSDDPAWEAPDEEWGLTTRRLTSSTRTAGKTMTVRPQQLRWVVDGDVGEYVEQYGTGEAHQLPSSYGGFNEWETVVAHVDGLCDEYGWGIDGQAVEKALRLLSGGGRYQASDYTVIICGRQPWLLTGSEGTLLCSCVPVNKPDESQQRESDITSGTHSFAIEEENPQVRAGVEHAVDLIEASMGDEIVEAEYGSRRSDTVHTLHGSARYTVSAADLAVLGRLETDPDAIGTRLRRGIEPPISGKQISVDWEPRHEVGEVVDDDIIAGYEVVWETPEDALETVATVRTYRLTNSYSRYKIDHRSDRLATMVL